MTHLYKFYFDYYYYNYYLLHLRKRTKSFDVFFSFIFDLRFGTKSKKKNYVYTIDFHIVILFFLILN